MDIFIQKLPKVEIHLHLEAAFSLETLWDLIQKYGGDHEVMDMNNLREKFIFKDFPHFIKNWVWKNNYLREYEDFEIIAKSAAEELVRQNIFYAEMSFTPGDFSRNGLTNACLLAEKIRKGLNKVKETNVQLIVDLCRDYGSDEGKHYLYELAEVKESLGIVGITIGGSEHEFPPEPYAEVYKLARELGFKCSAHAGEASGPKSIWGAIESLKVDRIGHGVRSTEDPKLVDYIVEKKIPLELCPISNIKTNVISDMSKHSIRILYDRGAVVTVNTDDPLMFNNSMYDDLTEIKQHLGFSNSDIIQLMKNAINSSWATESVKREYVKRLSLYDDLP